jgi:hypothetical protein
MNDTHQQDYKFCRLATLNSTQRKKQVTCLINKKTVIFKREKN